MATNILKNLIKRNPEDANCAFCGKENDYYDEDGFFYLWTKANAEFASGQAACKACVNGKPGKMHNKLHGAGDRN